MPAEETVMDAVNAALGEVVTTPEPENTDADAEDVSLHETDGDAPSDGDEGGDESSAEGDGADPETDGEGETDAEAEARGAERDPVTGKFIKNGEEKKPEPEQKATDKQKAEPPKKDPINDPIPANLKKETQDRMRSLIDTAKELTASRDKIQTDFDYLIKGVEATGTTPEQYGETLSWLALFNSRDPAQQEKALELVENVADRLATLLGKERKVGDPLAAHADLKDALAKGQITKEYAAEIARVRNGQQFRTELTTNANQEQQRQEAARVELNTAREGLTALENTLRSTDPQYEAKRALLVPVLKPIFAAIPPSQWVAKFQEAYKNTKVSAPAAPKPKGVPPNQPLRAGKQPAGGQTRAPSSMLEAVSGAIAGMGK